MVFLLLLLKTFFFFFLSFATKSAHHIFEMERGEKREKKALDYFCYVNKIETSNLFLVCQREQPFEYEYAHWYLQTVFAKHNNKNSTKTSKSFNVHASKSQFYLKQLNEGFSTNYKVQMRCQRVYGKQTVSIIFYSGNGMQSQSALKAHSFAFSYHFYQMHKSQPKTWTMNMQCYYFVVFVHAFFWLDSFYCNGTKLCVPVCLYLW